VHLPIVDAEHPARFDLDAVDRSLTRLAWTPPQEPRV
jgi:hypothetical protein